MTDTQVPIIGWERRYMTPSECAQLQSLGSITLPESRGAAYKALGNAVNSKVVGEIASPLLRSLLDPAVEQLELAPSAVVVSLAAGRKAS
jgi:DNA (cytosine-5)-methyltransferase 1